MSELAGAIYDRGYRPYGGPRLGRRGSVLALYRATLRRALGLRRPWRQKLWPAVLLGIAVLPALVNVGVGYVTRNSPAEDFEFITYREYVGVSTALLLFVALTAPDVICPDRRQRVLSLLYARPIDHRDYTAARIAGIATCVFAFSYLPQIVLFVGQMVVSDDAFDYFTDNAEVLWQVPLAVAILAIFYAVVGVAIASLSSRRAVAGASILGFTLVTSIVAGVLVHGDEAESNVVDDGNLAGLLNVLALPLHLRDLIFLGHIDAQSELGGAPGAGPLAIVAYLGVLAIGVLITLRRAQQAEP